MNRTRIKPFQPADLTRLEQLAREDGHGGVMAPTQTVWHNGTPQGYLSLGMVPNLLVWLNSKTFKSRDTLAVMDFAENWFAAFKQPGFMVPIHENSPFYPMMKHFPEYVDYGNYHMYARIMANDNNHYGNQKGVTV